MARLQEGSARPTSDLSAVRKPGRHPQVRAWLGAQREQDLFLSVRGLLSARTGNPGTDDQIAATALVHGATLATRNVRHHLATGVPLVDPFDARPR
jgi:predicted nucleic acid-binding protein